MYEHVVYFASKKTQTLSPTMLWFVLQVAVVEKRLPRFPVDRSRTFMTIDHNVVVNVMQSTCSRKSDKLYTLSKAVTDIGKGDTLERTHCFQM